MAIKSVYKESINGTVLSEIKTDESGVISNDAVKEVVDTPIASEVKVNTNYGFTGTDLESVLQELYSICE